MNKFWEFYYDWGWMVFIVIAALVWLFFAKACGQTRTSSHQYHAPGIEQFNDTLHVTHGTYTFKFRLRE